MGVAWLFNGSCHLSLYRTDFYVCSRRHPDALAREFQLNDEPREFV
jgi:hypothetical protein